MKNQRSIPLLLLAAFLLSACTEAGKGIAKGHPPKDEGGKSPNPSAAESQAEPRDQDPRAAYDSSGVMGGLSAKLESPVALLRSQGSPEAGPSLALGSDLSEAAMASRISGDPTRTKSHELILASGARASLPGPALALAATGDCYVVAVSYEQGGMLVGLKAEGEGERLLQSWKKEGPAVRRLMAIPGGRILCAEDQDRSPRLFLIDAVSGSELWGLTLPGPANDIAYAPGLALAATDSQLGAYDESRGTIQWIASLPAKARTLSAGNGVALIVAASGSLSAYSLSDGKGIGASPGPFDPSLRPVSDGNQALAAIQGGGASELEVRTGKVLRTWTWSGSSSFLAADRSRIYAGLKQGALPYLYIASRTGESAQSRVELPAPAFEAPVAVSGSRGGLLLLCQDGSLVLVGRELETQGNSIFDKELVPASATIAAIGRSLAFYLPEKQKGGKASIRFDVFAQGVPLAQDSDFTAFRYDSGSTGRQRFRLEPASANAPLCIFDEAGKQLSEPGDVGHSSASLAKGKSYWIVAGQTVSSDGATIRIFTEGR